MSCRRARGARAGAGPRTPFIVPLHFEEGSGTLKPLSPLRELVFLDGFAVPMHLETSLGASSPRRCT